MKGFYQNVFPTSQVTALLTHNNTYPLHNIYFALRWGEHVFKRYNDEKVPISFSSSESLRNYLIENTPDTVNVQFPENARPLVFDADIQDFDTSVRECDCAEKSVCNECWAQIMRPAMICAKAFLCDFLQFKEVLFVFSGRKGFHIWVTDERVWSWNLQARQNYADRMPIPFDMPITTGRGHLIKVPWGRHQKSGLVACTIENVETFLPYAEK